MTALSDASNQEIQDEVLPEEPDELAVPVELNTLKPWHRPRKQFIRNRLWIEFSRRLIRKEKNKPGLQTPVEGKPEVRYLTLPGIDYLDVRMLAELCSEQDCCLTSVGFYSGDERTNRNVARAKVREFDLISANIITRSSETYYRRFEEIADKGQAYRNLQHKGPFHIVNIDACGSVALPNAEHATRLIDAIYRIVEFQLDNKSSRWLLFISTDIRPVSLSQETLSNLCKAIFKNAENSEAFREKVLFMFGENDAEIESVVATAMNSSGEEFLKLFALSLSKWLLHLASDKNWNMTTHDTYCYATGISGNDTPTMVCLAFEFMPPPHGLNDPHSVVRAQPAVGNEPGDTSIQAANKVADMENVDCRMKSRHKLRKKMTNQVRQLLEEACYNPTTLDDLEGY